MRQGGATPWHSGAGIAARFSVLALASVVAGFQGVASAQAPADDALLELLDSEPAEEATPPAADNAAAASSATAPAADTVESPPAMIPVAQKPDPVPAAAAMPQHRQIEEIVVTATKRAESVREIPQSISAVSGEALEDQGKLNLVDYIAQTPGLTVSQGSPGLSRFTIRGISTDTSPASNVPSPVGILIGDTAFSEPYLVNIVPDLSAFDLSGVQVLKGPQGTLFGGSALSGAIRYEMQQPVQGEWQARGFVQTVEPEDGSLAVTSGIAVNIPLLSDKNLALRLAYLRRNYPGVIDDLRSGDQDIEEGSGNQYRAILLWEPGDWKLKYTHLSQDFEAPNAVSSVINPEGPRETDLAVGKIPASSEFGLESLEISHDFDSVRLTSLSSTTFKDASFPTDQTPAVVGRPPALYPERLAFLGYTTANSESWAQELRAQSTGSGPFEWLVGAYYYRFKMDFRLGVPIPLTNQLIGPGTLLYQLAERLGLPIEQVRQTVSLLDGTSDVKSSEKALFGDFSYTLWDRLKLNAGARLYETTVAGGFLGTGLLVRAANGGMNADSRAEINEHGINPKFAATWIFSDDVSLYAAIAKGYRFGGLQIAPSTATNGVPESFHSDTLWNHEIGLRTTWLDRSLTADLTAFYIRYKDPIVAQMTSGIPLGYNDNVGGAISRGLEAALLWYTPVEGLSLSLTGALTDAYTTAPYSAPGGIEVAAGAEMPGTARTQYNAGLQYMRSLGFLNVGLSTGYNYVGQGYSNIQHDIEINGYGTWDAGLILSSEALPLRPKLAINLGNILDEARPNSGGVVGPLLPVGDFNTYTLIPPRTLSMRLSFEF